MPRPAVSCLVLAALLLPACGGPAGSASTGHQGAPAPNFSLTDQFGHREQLAAFRGRMVLLTFVDSRCTTLCPLTADVMASTKALLGPASRVQLLAINANPEHTKVSDVRKWSVEHRMLREWLFLTGSIGTLRTVWRDYEIHVSFAHGDVAHAAIIEVIDAAGRIRAIFPSAAQRKGVGAEAQSVARAVRLVTDTG